VQMSLLLSVSVCNSKACKYLPNANSII
jgi:hypothetical protein